MIEKNSDLNQFFGDIKWLFFDRGSTLIDETDVYKSRCDYAMKQKNIKPEEFMAKVYEAAKTSPTAIKSAAQYYDVILPKWAHRMEKLYEGTKNVLETLSGKYRLGVIANQSMGTQERIDNWGIGNYFEVVVASAEAGCAKPDLKIFNLALEQAGCEPDEAIMVGDRLDNDIAPAKLLGMKTVWVRQGFAKYQSINNENERPDYIVDDIAELVNVL